MKTELPSISRLKLRASKSRVSKSYAVYDYVPVEIREVSRSELNNVVSWQLTNSGYAAEHNGRLYAPVDLFPMIRFNKRTSGNKLGAVCGSTLSRENHCENVLAVANLYARRLWSGPEYAHLNVQHYWRVISGRHNGHIDKVPVIAAEEVVDWKGNDDAFNRECLNTQKWIEETVLIVDGNVWIQIEAPRLTTNVGMRTLGIGNDDWIREHLKIIPIIKPANPFFGREARALEIYGKCDKLREINHPTYEFDQLDRIVDLLRDSYNLRINYRSSDYIIEINDPTLLRAPCEAGHLQSVAIDVVDEEFQYLAEAERSSLMAWANLRDELKRIKVSYEQIGTTDEADTERLYQAAVEYQDHCQTETLRHALSVASERWNQRDLTTDIESDNSPVGSFGY